MFVLIRYWTEILYQQEGPLNGDEAIRKVDLYLKDKRTYRIVLRRLPDGTD